MGEGLLLLFLFAFAIYPVQRFFWKTFYYTNKLAFMPYFITIVTIGWGLIPVWFYVGFIWSRYLGFGRSAEESVGEILEGAYFLIWVAVVIWMSAKAWMAAEDEYGKRQNRQVGG